MPTPLPNSGSVHLTIPGAQGAMSVLLNREAQAVVVWKADVEEVRNPINNSPELWPGRKQRAINSHGGRVKTPSSWDGRKEAVKIMSAQGGEEKRRSVVIHGSDRPCLIKEEVVLVFPPREIDGLVECEEARGVGPAGGWGRALGTASPGQPASEPASPPQQPP
ncbi:hypothetical protein AXG93_4170s1280 [Marchantia polymorpha subsp. ruderalis]|uniref:Uncharacterized protein n=1 Tax=Marchantia polymorpha subsp. ruderalis TaxID=1480154 RepID=A0A176VM49_MARPO|nr:hypothetical protein AXG93_4170s1280 [Marchantia polymorpha subsp. ruderalis]